MCGNWKRLITVGSHQSILHWRAVITVGNIISGLFRVRLVIDSGRGQSTWYFGNMSCHFYDK